GRRGSVLLDRAPECLGTRSLLGGFLELWGDLRGEEPRAGVGKDRSELFVPRHYSVPGGSGRRSCWGLARLASGCASHCGPGPPHWFAHDACRYGTARVPNAPLIAAPARAR